MRNTSVENTVDIMRTTLFASYGLPEEVVSDNGPQFTSSVFKSFLKNNGVKQTLSPPYHPALNGAAEQSIQILKRSLERQVLHSKDSLSTAHKLANFLFAYRNTPHTVTEETPVSLFLKRAPHTRLSLLYPNLAESVEKQQQNQKNYHDSTNQKLREFKPHEAVQVKKFSKRGN